MFTRRGGGAEEKTARKLSSYIAKCVYQDYGKNWEKVPAPEEIGERSEPRKA